MLLLALVVLGSAIFVFFSDEFVKFLGKIFSIPGVKLLLPLALASLIIEAYEDWGYWLLVKAQAFLHQFVNKFATFLPFEWGAVAVTRIVIIFLFICLPIWFFRIRAKKKGQRHPQRLAYYLGLTLWIFAVILLTVATAPISA
jgi:hypothetical protein